MQFLQNPIGYFKPTTPRKVIYLSAQHTWTYICVQILDILHDTYDTDGHHAVITEESIKAIATLYVRWMTTINMTLDDASRDGFIVTVILNKVWQMLKPFNDKLITEAIAAFIAKIPFEKVNMTQRVINDNCDVFHNNTPIVCETCQLQPVITASVLYDQGSHDKNCAFKEFVDVEPDIPQPLKSQSYIQQPEYQYWHNVLSQYNFLEKINDTDAMYNTAQIIKCQSMEHFDPNDVALHDMAIVGRIDIARIAGEQRYVRFFLAYRGINSAKDENGNLVCSFTFLFDRTHTITRAYNSSRSKNLPIVGNWINLCKSHTATHTPYQIARQLNYEILRAYAELSSKHWGDLGMIFDGVFSNSTITVITSDYLLQLMCALFKAQYTYCVDGVATPKSEVIKSQLPLNDVAIKIINTSNLQDILNACPSFVV